jgi:PAS domain S-box-containing protein
LFELKSALGISINQPNDIRFAVAAPYPGMLIQETSFEKQRTERLNLWGVLFRSVEPAIVVIDAQRNVTAFNRVAERITGLQAQAVLGQKMAGLPSPLQQVIEETFVSGKPVADRTVVLFPDAEEKLAVHTNTSLCANASGLPLVVVAVFHDLDSARKLERRIRRLERLASIGTLSAGVAHEIKNALVAIKSFADLLAQRNQDVEMTSLISREAKRIDSLVNQLLKFAGPAKPTFATVSLHEVIENSLRLVQHQLKVRKIRLVRALDAGHDQVQGDAKQLEQALINLLLNAVEAMEEMGTLTVATELVVATEHISRAEPKGTKEQIQVSIKDTGSGIPPELATRLFVPFMTTKPEGTGLGLAITARIIQEHRGRIKVESEVNKGTIFKIMFPVTKAA